MKMQNFECITAEQAMSDYGWGIDLMPGSTVYRREEGEVSTWVGHSREQDCWVCEIELGGGCAAQAYADDPEGAFARAIVAYLAPIAAFEQWVKPMTLGLKVCCEDVVNWLTYEGYRAFVNGFRAIAYEIDTPIEMDDMSLLNRIGTYAIEYVRDHACELGIEFEDVWS